MAKQIKYLDLEGLKSLYGVVDGKITTAVNNAKTELKGGATTEGDTLGKLESKINNEVTRATGVEQTLSGKIDAMVLAKVGGTGKFVQSVSQSDGKVTAVAAELNAAAVAATAIKGDGSTVAVAGDTVAKQIQSLGQTLKTVEGNAAKYKVVKLSPEDIAKLSDSANVREAYQVVSWTGDEAAATPTQGGETIKIYKDAALLSVTPENGVAGENTVIKFTYSLANGDQKEVSVDLGQAIFESEMGDGMQVVDHKIAIKLDAANESEFLTVGENGLKLSGVQNAINAAVANKNVSAEGDDYITADTAGNKVSVHADVQDLTVAKTPDADSTIAGVEKSLVDGKEVADKVAAFTNARIGEEIAKLDATVGEAAVAADKHVAVQVVETDGRITAVNVNEKDIASKTALDDEIARATAAEDKIEASVGLAADGSFTAPAGNYINGAATVMDAVKKLDVQAKANADKIAGMSVDEVYQTVTIDSKGLQFVALTPQEIQNAATSAAGK